MAGCVAKTPVVLFCIGCFNPVTNKHLRMLGKLELDIHIFIYSAGVMTLSQSQQSFKFHVYLYVNTITPLAQSGLCSIEAGSCLHYYFCCISLLIMSLPFIHSTELKYR